MSIRTLFAMLLAVVVLIAPALSRAGEARAATPDHHAQMLASGHCQPGKTATDTREDQSMHHGKAGKTCCLATCTALAVQPAPVLADELGHKTPALFTVPAFHVGSPAELATPPPRLS